MVPCEFFTNINRPIIREDIYQDEWDNLSEDCRKGLRAKFGNVASIKGMLLAVNRAVASMNTLRRSQQTLTE